MKFRSNRILSRIVMTVSLFWMLACSSSTSDSTATLGDWSRTTPFKGRPRSGAIAFTIGSKAFVGLGFDGDDYLSDFYVYDVSSGYWESKQSFPGQLRERAVAFSINGKGYVGLGYNRDLDKEELGDFWEFDPEAADGSQWTQVADFGGTARYNAVAFAIGASGYVGTGYDGDTYNSDFWQYTPETNEWKEVKSYPGDKIDGGLAFVVNDKGYVCTGRNNGLHTTSFWQFDPESVSWTKKSPASDASDYDEFSAAVLRHDATALVVDNKAYIVGGINSSNAVIQSVYVYNPADNTWDDRTSFEGAARSLMVSFVLDGQAFVGTGQNGTSRYDDVWIFDPNKSYSEDY